VYFAPNTLQSFINAVNTAVHDAANNPSVISISWGASEDNWSANSRQAMDNVLKAAGLLGVSVCTASADNGSGDKATDGKAHADFPSSSPNALACGGTSLTANGTVIATEVVWNNGPGQISGGGISDAFPVPAYQAAVGLPPSANPGANLGRGVPDVAGHAASYSIRFFGQNISAFGTSAVAPLWAGLIALLNQSESPGRVGLPHSKLYGGSQALNDITVGNNGAYAARVGWDACTGLGSPKSIQLVLGNQGYYMKRVLEVPTTFANETDGTWLMADWDRDGIPDLVFTPNGHV
jgi:kumamolisin